jgi:DNA replication protein DnaC
MLLRTAFINNAWSISSNPRNGGTRVRRTRRESNPARAARHLQNHVGGGARDQGDRGGHRGLFLTLETLITRLRRAQAENRLEWQLAQWITPKVLVVDQLGYLPMSQEEVNLFFRLVARRYERATLIITSNKSFID